MKVRVATTRDTNKIIELAQASILEIASNNYTPEQTKVWANRLERPNRISNAVAEQHFIVAELEHEIIGFGSILNGDYIDFLYVHPLHVKNGVATTIFKPLIAHAHKHKTKTITSDVSKTARPFFEKKGFKVLREQENKMGNEILVNYKMELKL